MGEGSAAVTPASKTILSVVISMIVACRLDVNNGI